MARHREIVATTAAVLALVAGTLAVALAPSLATAAETPLTVSTTVVDFGVVEVGSTSSVPVVVTNTGGAPFGPINMFGGAPPSAAFNASQSCQGTTLPAGGSCAITYSFSPTASGSAADTSSFTISATASQVDGEDFTITLTGTGASSFEPYRRWASPKGYSCTSQPGGALVTLAEQDVEFNDLPVDAQYTLNYISNGVIQTSGPHPVEQTSGTRAYAPFGASFPGGYPFTFEFRIDTLIDGFVVHRSSLAIACAGDTTGTVAADDTPVARFSDVPTGHPFFEEVQWMAATGLSTGADDGRYQPAATLTRGAMSAFLYRLDGSPHGDDPQCATAPFTDVPTTHPFCGEIAWMKATGLALGSGDGSTYRPAQGLTRGAMSAFLHRAANPGTTPAPCAAPPFTDVPTTHPFCGEIAWMGTAGISTGTADGRYLPGQALTRGAMAAFLYRYAQVIPTGL